MTEVFSLKPYEILKGKILSQIDIADAEIKYNRHLETQIEKIEKHTAKMKLMSFSVSILEVSSQTMQKQYSKLDKTRYHKTIFLDEYESKIGLKNNEIKQDILLKKHFRILRIFMLKC